MFINEGIFTWAKMSFKDFELKTHAVGVWSCSLWQMGPNCQSHDLSVTSAHTTIPTGIT